MADMTQQGPQTTERNRDDRRGQGQNPDLDQLTVSELFSGPETASLPRHTATSVAQRWDEKLFDTGAMMRGEIVGGRGTPHETWEVKLSGPTSVDTPSLWTLLTPWNKPEWREITIQMHVGSEDCPDWNHVNLCMTAIQELITMAHGTISDEVLAALQAHVDVIDVRTLRAPPRH
jgi:hypothetical protein